MAGDVSKNVLSGIRKLYRENAVAQNLFDWVASRQRDATSTTLTRLSSHLGISRGEAVSLARALENAGCGEFRVGRRGQKSRFVWSYSCISLGKAAAGEDDELEEVANPVPDAEEDDEVAGFDVAPPVTAIAPIPPPLTIAEAKAGLARALGIPITSIEIIIRS